MNVIKYILTFGAGAALGSGITYYIVSKKKDKECQEDIDSVKAEYNKRIEAAEKKTEEIPSEDEMAEMEAPDDSDIPTFHPDVEIDDSEIPESAIRTGVNYASKYMTASKDVPENVVRRNIVPISIDEYDEDDAFTKQELIFYDEDSILADSSSDEVRSLDDIGGVPMLDHIGDDAQDMLFVRDLDTAVDYSISVMHTSYNRIMGYMEEDE